MTDEAWTAEDTAHMLAGGHAVGDDLAIPEEPEVFEVLLRPMVTGDINLVSNSWLKNNRKAWSSRGIRDDIYYGNHHKVLQKLIRRSAVVVACNPSAPDQVYGWLCGEFVGNHLVLHYVYVKDAYKFKYNRNVPRRFREAGAPVEQRKGLGLGTLMLERMLEGHPGGRDACRGIVTTHSTESGDKWLKALYDGCRLEHAYVYNPYFLYKEAL